MPDLRSQIQKCSLCATRFALTHTAHRPRPVAWFQPNARILLAGQAPGMRVHTSGRPFDDRSGDRLRDWLGVDRDTFYDTSLFAVVPMAFCFPGYNSKGHDLAPPKICATTWRQAVMDDLQSVQLTVLIGRYAQDWHLPGSMGVTARVKAWADYAPNTFVVPHPSWRNTSWLKANPFFETDVLPELKSRVQKVLRQ